MLSQDARRKIATTAAMLAAAAIGVRAIASHAQTVSDEVVVTAHSHGAHDRTSMVKVRYHDLDLKTEAGRKALDQRIKAAAHKACLRIGEHAMGAGQAQPSCEQEAVTSAADQEKVALNQARAH